MIARADRPDIDPDEETRRPIRGAPRGRRAAPPTLAELERGRRQAAILVRVYGERYLPIFERIDDECHVAARREESLARVRQFAGVDGANAS